MIAVACLLLQIAVPDSGTASLVASLRGGRADPVAFVLAALRRHRVVMLGDIHPAAEPKRIVQEVIAAHVREGALSAVALEVGRDQQGVIDRYLASDPEDTTILLDHPVTLRVVWGASREYLGIYRSAWRHNHGPGRAAPIALVAADVPGWPIPALSVGMALQAFANRDLGLAANLAQALERLGPDAHLLVLFGGYHGLKRVTARVSGRGAGLTLDGWAGGLLAARGVDVYTILSDGASGGGELSTGATQLFPLAERAGLRAPFAVALDSTVDVVPEPLMPIVQEGMSLEFVPRRFSLREAVDGYLFLGRFQRTTPL
ncbi:MAG: hypothetical protein ACREMF_03815 [Gemmatimonadales bacterium]